MVSLQLPLPPPEFVLHGTVILTPQELALPQIHSFAELFQPHPHAPPCFTKLLRLFWPAHAPCSPLPAHTSLPRSLVPLGYLQRWLGPNARKCPQNRVQTTGKDSFPPSTLIIFELPPPRPILGGKKRIVACKWV